MEASPDAEMLSWRKMATTRSSLTGQTRTATSTRNSGCRWAWSARRPEAAPTTESQSSEVALLLAFFCFQKLHKTQIFSLAKTFNLRLIYDRFVAIKIFHNFSSIFSFTQGHECKKFQRMSATRVDNNLSRRSSNGNWSPNESLQGEHTWCSLLSIYLIVCKNTEANSFLVLTHGMLFLTH